MVKVSFDWKVILGIAAVAGIGYVAYKFWKGDWKLPDLGDLFKFPTLTMPTLPTLPDIIMPEAPGATLPEVFFAKAFDSVPSPVMIRIRELTGLPYAAPPEVFRKTPEERGLVAPYEAPISTPVPSPSMMEEGIRYLMEQGKTREEAEWIYAGGIQGQGREVIAPLVEALPGTLTYGYTRIVQERENQRVIPLAGRVVVM